MFESVVVGLFPAPGSPVGLGGDVFVAIVLVLFAIFWVAGWVRLARDENGRVQVVPIILGVAFVIFFAVIWFANRGENVWSPSD